MENYFVLGGAVLLLIGLVDAEKTALPRRILFFKAPLSLLFILAWALQTPQNDFVSSLILAGLVVCLVGDVLLAFGSRTTFLLGLICFLFGHLIYTAAFFSAATMGPWSAPAALLVMVSGGLIWRWLKPFLGTMELPVLAYIVVISGMVCGAWGVLATSAIPPPARMGLFAGAVLFYLSDICVARQRFVVSAPSNRVIGLPLYYMAQFLFAFSAAWIPA